MKFYFKNVKQFYEAVESLFRFNIGFTYYEKALEIEIDPIDHDQLPIYDETIVNHLKGICGECSKRDSADDLLAKEIKRNDVAG